MADLKKDLDEYLLLQSDQKKNFKLTMPAIPLQKPNISNWFRREEPPEDESWYQETRKQCCPSLVSVSAANCNRTKLGELVRRGFNE